MCASAKNEVDNPKLLRVARALAGAYTGNPQGHGSGVHPQVQGIPRAEQGIRGEQHDGTLGSIQPALYGISAFAVVGCLKGQSGGGSAAFSRVAQGLVEQTFDAAGVDVRACSAGCLRGWSESHGMLVAR